MATVQAVAAIIERGGRVLALRRPAGASGEGVWELPGGRMRPGEDAQAALRRTVDESVSLPLSTVWPLEHLACNQADQYIELDCFVAMPLPGADPLSRSCDELRWVGHDELASLEWAACDRQLVELLGRFWDQLFASAHL